MDVDADVDADVDVEEWKRKAGRLSLLRGHGTTGTPVGEPPHGRSWHRRLLGPTGKRRDAKLGRRGRVEDARHHVSDVVQYISFRLYRASCVAEMDDLAVRILPLDEDRDGCWQSACGASTKARCKQIYILRCTRYISSRHS